MESSASARVLREPALLYLILSRLSQADLLLRAQSVSQLWHRFISTDSRLLTIMWLYPAAPVERVDEATTQINPLLQRVFRMLFKSCFFQDSFTKDFGGPTPFADMRDFEPQSEQQITMKYPNASWRRMVPCSPAPDQLLVNVLGQEGGRLMWLNFSNRINQDMRPSHPPWLTFGFLYDIAECAWHQANPWRVHQVRFDFPSASLDPRPLLEYVPREAVISEVLRALAKCRPGLVRLHLEPDTRSEVERQTAYEASVAERIRLHKKRGRCGTKFPIYKENITNELHFADALSLYEIEWDEAHEYDMPPREMPVTESSTPRRRFLGMRLRRNG